MSVWFVFCCFCLVCPVFCDVVVKFACGLVSVWFLCDLLWLLSCFNNI